MNDLGICGICLQVVQDHANLRNHCITLNISETVKNSALIPMDHQYEMAYVESNSHVTEDVTWLRKVKLVTPIRLEPNISKSTGDAIQQQT